MPWRRAITEAREGRIDGIIGALRNEVPDFIYPETSCGIAQNGFYSITDGWRYRGAESLKEPIFGIAGGYSYGNIIDRFITDKTIRTDVVCSRTPLISNIKKLLEGRITALVAERSVMQYTIKTLGLEDSIQYAGTPAEPEAVYIAFPPELPNSKGYARILTEGIPKLRESGELTAIMHSYGLKDWQ